MPPKQLPQRDVPTPSIFSVSPYSSAVAKDMYPGQTGVDDQRDAARHLLAAGTLARKYGVAPAELLGKMHEWSTSPIEALKMMLGAAPTPEYLMDTRNNAYGAQLGMQAKSQGELEDMVQREAERAQLNAPAGRAALLKPAYAKGGSVKDTKVLKSGEGLNELTKQYPELSGFLESFMGTAPDEMGSVLDPLTARRRAGAEYGFPAGVAAQVAPGLGPLAKLAGRGAGAVARGGAEQIARAVEAGHPLTAGFAPMNVIKPKGGNWISGSAENALKGLKRNASQFENPNLSAEEVLLQNELNAPLNKFVEGPLTKYVKTQMATPEDPIRAQAERGVSHMVTPYQGFDAGTMGGRRIQAGYPAEGMGKSEMARDWELTSDEALHNIPAGSHLRSSAVSLVEANPWLSKVPPETPAYGAYNVRDLGFGHLTDELRNALNPESGLPRHLLLTPEQMQGYGVEKAVQRVADINDWRAAQKAEANQGLAFNPAASMFKEYPGEANPRGLHWRELKQPEAVLQEGHVPGNVSGYPDLHGIIDQRTGQSVSIGSSPEEALKLYGRKEREAALGEQLKYEGEQMGHCVGGYCPDVVEGKSKIYSLRDAKGQPHVTIETKPGSLDYNSLPPGLRSEVYERTKKIWVSKYKRNDPLGNRFGEVEDKVMKDMLGSGEIDISTPSIVQIKGKGNKAPVEEYLPMVQDFVKSGKWSEVGDLQNTGLQKWDDKYLTRAEIDALSPADSDAFSSRNLGKPGFAAGGLVNDSISGYNPARVDEIVNSLRTELFQ